MKDYLRMLLTMFGGYQFMSPWGKGCCKVTLLLALIVPKRVLPNYVKQT